MGEGVTNEELLMPYISSCSIACGGHYGSRSSIAETLTKALKYQVKVGAHPSYPDRENFGRKSIGMSRVDFQDAIRKQLDLFYHLTSNVNHIKPHGALYNDLFSDEEKGGWFLDVIAEYTSGIKIYCSPNSVLSSLAQQQDFQAVFEGFGDRLYTAVGTLVDRSVQGSVFDNKKQIIDQIIGLATNDQVITSNGSPLSIKVQTICLHSDTPGLIKIIASLIQCLKENKINVAPI